MQSPYLPDIMEGVVTRVSDAFFARATDPFKVFFDKGIQKQVGRSIYQKGLDKTDTFPLVWLVMPFTEKRGDASVFSEDSCTIIIAMPTDNKYTQSDRDLYTFKPRLIPIYEVLLQEIARERWFILQGPNKISHTRIFRPYWGGGDVSGADSDNLFKKKVDAIAITGLQLKLNYQNCNQNGYSLNKNTNYQPIPSDDFNDDFGLDFN